MKTLQEQYNLIKEGKGHKDIFLKEAKKKFHVLKKWKILVKKIKNI